MRDLLPDLSAEDGSSSFQPLQNEGFASLSASQQAHERLDSLSTFSSQVERQESAEDSWSDKLSREAVVLTWGVGGAFVDTITDPLSKAPEIATAGAFGVGLRVLEHAGARGKALAGVIGLGLLA
ncbi:MAG: hypothetical protein K2Z81_18545, partial [Cyanobacteria bacterium]|nr:hypothetical protein [Cyanobacteriota bacterium]